MDSSKSDIVKLIGDRIREYRKQLGMSQEELAFQSGLHVSYVGKVERSEKSMTIDTLVKITNALGITPERLFQGIELPKSEYSVTLQKIINRLKISSIAEQEKILALIDIVLD